MVDADPHGARGGEQYYPTTYCSEACHAAASPDMLSHDEVMC